MPKSSGLAAGKAYIEMSLKDGKLKAGLERVKAAFGRIKKAAAASMSAVKTGIMAASAALAGFTAAAGKAVFKFMELGDQAHKLNARTGFSTKMFTGLSHAAELAGGSTKDLETAMIKLSRRLGDVQRLNNFEKMGVNARKIKELAPDEQFFAIAEALTKVENQSDKARLAYEMMGSGGQKLLPMFEKGAAGLRDMINASEELGLTMDQNQADKAALITDKWEDLKDTFLGFTISIGEAFAPWFEWMIDGIMHVIQNWKKFFTEGINWILSKVESMYRIIGKGFESIGFEAMADDYLKAARRVQLQIAKNNREGAFGIGPADPFVEWGQLRASLRDREGNEDTDDTGAMAIETVEKALSRVTRGAYGASANMLDRAERVQEEQLKVLKDIYKEAKKDNHAKWKI